MLSDIKSQDEVGNAYTLGIFHLKKGRGLLDYTPKNHTTNFISD